MAKTLHILIADDDGDDRMIISDAIKSFANEAIDIFEVSNGAELIEYLEKNSKTRQPDVILLDINMPVMDGVEALRIIRSRQDFTNIPIYIVSTFRELEKAEEITALGVMKLYTKPNEMIGYEEMVSDVLSK